MICKITIKMSPTLEPLWSSDRVKLKCWLDELHWGKLGLQFMQTNVTFNNCKTCLNGFQVWWVASREKIVPIKYMLQCHTGVIMIVNGCIVNDAKMTDCDKWKHSFFLKLHELFMSNPALKNFPTQKSKWCDSSQHREWSIIEYDLPINAAFAFLSPPIFFQKWFAIACSLIDIDAIHWIQVTNTLQKLQSLDMIAMNVPGALDFTSQSMAM